MNTRIASKYRTRKPVESYWLSEIPSHWDIQRLKFTVDGCFNGTWGSEAEGADEDLPCVRVADFDRTRFVVIEQIPTVRCIPRAERRRRELRRGNLLLEKSGGGGLQPVGAVVLFDSDATAVCSNFIARMPVAAGFDPRFLSYLHAALYSGRVNERSIKQTTGIQNLDSESYLSECVPIPPLDEQRTIATFLDRETARLDALIEKKRRLIKLLQEKRAAAITLAVTRGLGARVQMRNTGISAIGSIPQRWSVKRLKHVSPRLMVGIVVNPSTFVSNNGKPFLVGSNIKEGEIDWRRAARIDDVGNQANAKSILKKGDLVTVRVGAPGVTAVVSDEVAGGNAASVMITRGHESFNSDWLCHVMNSRVVRSQIEMIQYGAAQEQFNISHAVDFWIPVPSLSEQHQIIAYLDTIVDRIGRLTALLTETLERLEEQRSALIAASVTGQIDVREAA